MIETLKELLSILESDENILEVLERKKEEHLFLNGYEKELGVRRRYAEALYAAYVLLTVNGYGFTAGSVYYLFDCARKYTMPIADYLRFMELDDADSKSRFITKVKTDLAEAIVTLENDLLAGIELF